MKSKLSWILFIPLTLAAVFCKLAQSMLPDNSIFGLSDMMLDYVTIGCVVLIFIFALIMCLCDRKISKYYLPHRNIPAGILGILLALLLAADGANIIYSIVGKIEGKDKIDVLEIVLAVFMLFAAVVFVVMGLTHSFSNKNKKGFGLLYVAPALLCAVRLINCFVEFTTISITQADVTRLVCYIFATMFFFNYAVALSLTEAKNAVKSNFIYGFPAAAALIAYASGNLYKTIANREIRIETLMDSAEVAEIALMGLYILAFLIELTIFVKDKDHVKIAEEDDVDYKDLHEDDITDEEGLMVTGLDDEERVDTPATSYLSTADTTEYLYRESREEEKRDSSYLKAAANDVDDYITGEVEDAYATTERESYADQLDEIDKLILEISEEDAK